ncbi:MAG: hypothetical protein ACTSWN_00775 [Promethearchaeota archaeon]
MPYKRDTKVGYTCLFNKSFNELLDIYDDNYSQLFNLLHDTLNVKIYINREKYVAEEILEDINLLVLGCPSKIKIDDRSIDSILKFVRAGGSLLVISDAGGDLANETNLNDLVSHFQISIKPTTVRDTFNCGSQVAPVLGNINLSHPIMKGVIKIAIGGGCTLQIEGTGSPLVKTNESSWIEQFSLKNNKAWSIVNTGSYWPIIATIPYGHGKIAISGDLDMFSNDIDYGINAFDNKKFITNLFSWLLEPIESRTVIDWLISRISRLEVAYEDLRQVNEMLTLENQKLKEKIKTLENLNSTIPYQIHEKEKEIK